MGNTEMLSPSPASLLMAFGYRASMMVMMCCISHAHHTLFTALCQHAQMGPVSTVQPGVCLAVTHTPVDLEDIHSAGLAGVGELNFAVNTSGAQQG